MGHYFINDTNLKSEIREFNISISELEFKFKTDNGVFSKDYLDYGTKLLIETVIKENINGKVLDLGCGYGAIGIILNKILKVNTLMIDINKRAVHLANLNIKENNCTNIRAIVSNGYSMVDDKFDYLVTNPPIRVGKDNLYSLINDAKKVLNPHGKIYLVIRKEQGAKTFIRDFSSSYEIDVLEKKKGFYIICLKS